MKEQKASERSTSVKSPPPSSPSPPSSSSASSAWKTGIQTFYKLVVQWIRGLQERNILLQEFNDLIDSESFSWSDASGTLWTPKDWITSLNYGSGAFWLTYELEIRKFSVLQTHAPNLALVSFEIWQVVLLDNSLKEITARKATAWLKQTGVVDNTSNHENRVILCHIHETWIKGLEPIANKQQQQQRQQQQQQKQKQNASSSLPIEQQNDGTIRAWKESNVPSRRRHISPRLEEFQAKPLLWEGKIVGISVKGWDIGTSQGPIGDETWFNNATDQLEKSSQYKLQDAHRRIVLPEMVFPAAHIALERTHGDIFLSWDAMDALKEWGEAHQAIPLTKSNAAFRGVSVLQTSDAKLWKNKSSFHVSESSSSSSSVFHYDWTYSTPFCGKVFGVAGVNGWKQLSASGMPMDLLTDQSVPILFFDEIILFEDDLHDNGEVQFSAKLRVMPTCAYILSKLFLRVDGVLLRLRECRLLVDFGAEKLYRDVTWRECLWNDLAKHQLPTDLRAWTQDSNKETPAFLYLLSKLPRVELPRDLYAHAEMDVSSKSSPLADTIDAKI